MFTLTFDDTWSDESVNIRILDVSGRQVQMIQGASRNGDIYQLPVRQWPTGIYMVQVIGHEKQVTLKLVVKH